MTYNPEAVVRLITERNALKREYDARGERIADLMGQLDELREAAEACRQCWSDYTSQEMYGEMLRDGMGWSSENEPGDPSDFECWEEAHDKLRDALAKVSK